MSSLDVGLILIGTIPLVLLGVEVVLAIQKRDRAKQLEKWRAPHE